MPEYIRDVSQATLQQTLTHESDLLLLTLLRIESPEAAETIRIVNDTKELVRSDGVYAPFPFDVPAMPEIQDAIPQVKLRLDNVHRDLVDDVRSLAGEVKVFFEQVNADTPDTPEYGPVELALKNTTIDALIIEGTLGDPYEIWDEPYPSESYTPYTHPGLFG